MNSLTLKKLDIYFLFFLNATSSLFAAASHNALYYVLDLRTLTFHFMHYFFSFIFFYILTKLSNINETSKLSIFSFTLLKKLLPLSLFQTLLTFLTSIVHSGNRHGSLYVLRICDCITTVVILKCWNLFVTTKDTKEKKQERNVEINDYWLLCPLAFFASLSWLEFGNIEYDIFSLLFAPILAGCRGIYLLYAKNTYKEIQKDDQNINFNNFCLNMCMITSSMLLIPAIVSASTSVVSADASWESIDYTLIGLSFLYMIGMKYSEFKLFLEVDLRYYAVMEHTKYFFASMGQWYIQNMAHATIYAFAGKIMYVISLIRFWLCQDKTKPIETNLTKHNDVKQEKYF
uniref:TPT domain-containing protein n=1 Tax=Strongyloides papillosus TaxID=174720 RepID=A0A0N5CAA7_STREA